MRSIENKPLWNQEYAILDFTELVCKTMKEKGITKKDLAQLLGTSQAEVTKILSGDRNISIRLMSDMLFHLGCQLVFGVKKKD